VIVLFVKVVYKKRITMKFKNILILIVTLSLIGCCKYSTLEKSYNTEQDAVVAFLKDNRNVLIYLKSSQEMLGWVLKYEDLYYNTTPYIGGLANPLNEGDIWKPNGYKVVAIVHTHPSPPFGQTADFFSREDLKAGKRWHMYLLAQENCNVRFASSDQYRSGTLLGRIDDCK